MTKKSFICKECEKRIEVTAIRSSVCRACHFKQKEKMGEEAQRKFLETLYTSVDVVEKDKHGHRVWEFTHPLCGSRQQAVFGNVLKQYRSTGHPLCRQCGNVRSQEKLLKGFLAKFGVSYDVDQYRDYSTLVRQFSNQVYQKNRDLLNPNGFSRMEYHLDHIVPVIKCFHENLPIEIAGGLSNLQMLPALENLKKNDSCKEEDLRRLKALQ